MKIQTHDLCMFHRYSDSLPQLSPCIPPCLNRRLFKWHCSVSTAFAIRQYVIDFSYQCQNYTANSLWRVATAAIQTAVTTPACPLRQCHVTCGPEDRSMRLASSTLPHKMTWNSGVACQHSNLLFCLQKLIADTVLNKIANIPDDIITFELWNVREQCLKISFPSHTRIIFRFHMKISHLKLFRKIIAVYSEPL
jgi:hypothetical protein